MLPIIRRQRLVSLQLLPQHHLPRLLPIRLLHHLQQVRLAARPHPIEVAVRHIPGTRVLRVGVRIALPRRLAIQRRVHRGVLHVVRLHRVASERLISTHHAPGQRSLRRVASIRIATHVGIYITRVVARLQPRLAAYGEEFTMRCGSTASRGLAERFPSACAAAASSSPPICAAGSKYGANSAVEGSTTTSVASREGSKRFAGLRGSLSLRWREKEAGTERWEARTWARRLRLRRKDGGRRG